MASLATQSVEKKALQWALLGKAALFYLESHTKGWVAQQDCSGAEALGVHPDSEIHMWEEETAACVYLQHLSHASPHILERWAKIELMFTCWKQKTRYLTPNGHILIKKWCWSMGFSWDFQKKITIKIFMLVNTRHQQFLLTFSHCFCLSELLQIQQTGWNMKDMVD